VIPALATDIAPMTDEDIGKVRALEDEVLARPQVALRTTHTLHAGVYTRTVRLPADVVLTGALIRVPTTLIVAGDASMFSGGTCRRLTGHHALTAAAGRKQAFVAHAETYITMIFATQAKTVEDAENEFTAEAHRLMTRRADQIEE